MKEGPLLLRRKERGAGASRGAIMIGKGTSSSIFGHQFLPIRSYACHFPHGCHHGSANLPSTLHKCFLVGVQTHQAGIAFLKKSHVRVILQFRQERAVAARAGLTAERGQRSSHGSSSRCSEIQKRRRHRCSAGRSKQTFFLLVRHDFP